MRKFILIILLLMIPLFAGAHYSLHSVTGDIKIESGGRQSVATKGMAVKASDYIIIPAGGKVEIYNDLDKRIYTSTATGKFTVTRLMIDARGAAADNRGNVASRLRFGKKDSPGDERLYVEKGMVKRSLGVYDPEGEKIVADPGVIARHIAARISSKEGFNPDSTPAKIEKGIPENGGIHFKVWNTLDFPIYFNIVKVTKKDAKYKISISEVGQPAGVYVLLPGQTISREHFIAIPGDEMHLMVMTHSQFDVDEMIEQLESTLKKGSIADSQPETGMPLYLMSI